MHRPVHVRCIVVLRRACPPTRCCENFLYDVFKGAPSAPRTGSAQPHARSRRELRRASPVGSPPCHAASARLSAKAHGGGRRGTEPRAAPPLRLTRNLTRTGRGPSFLPCASILEGAVEPSVIAHERIVVKPATRRILKGDRACSARS